MSAERQVNLFKIKWNNLLLWKPFLIFNTMLCSAFLDLMEELDLGDVDDLEGKL